ncbi:MAG: MFS transporter [Rhodovibrionaceae bacterium]|nr:MFS transporter [Rhodovibrionaceae bacterium]
MQALKRQLPLVFSCLGHAYMHMFAAFYFVIVLALEKDWSLPYHELLELWTLGALLIGLGALPAGWIADRWSSSGMMSVFFIGMGLAAIACGLVDSATAMLIGLAAIGLFAAVYHPVGIAWLVRNAESRGKALGINGVFGSIGIASAGLVAGTLIELFSWRAAFMVPGAICLATGIALVACRALGLVDDGVARLRKEAPASRGDMVRVYLILVLTMAVMGVIFQSTQAALPKVFDIRLASLVGGSAFGVGAVVAGVYTVGGIMQIAGGHLADRFPLKPIYLSAFLFQIPILLIIAVASGVPLVVAAALTVLLSTGALPAENMLLARYTPDRHQSLAFGAKFVLAFGTAPLAIQLVSWVKEASGEFTWLFAGLAAGAVVAVLAAAILPGAWRRQAETPAE